MVFKKNKPAQPRPGSEQNTVQHGTKNQSANIIGDNNLVIQNTADTRRQLCGRYRIDRPRTFIGWSHTLEAIGSHLRMQDRLVLSGMGGIGKSTLLRQFAADSSEEYEQIIFIEYSGSLQRSLEAGIIGWSKPNEIVKELNDLPDPQKRLLIIDGFDLPDGSAQDLDALKSMLKELRWKVLVSSRQTMALPRISFSKLNLDAPPVETGRLIFAQYYCDADDENTAIIGWRNLSAEFRRDADRLLQAVGCHTLAVEVMAKTLREAGNAVTVGELLDFTKNIVVNTDSHHAEETTLSTFLAQIFTLSNTGDYGKWLLQNIAALGAVTVSQDVLKDLLQIKANETDKFVNTLNNLAKNGWLQKYMTGGTKYFSCHQIIRSFISKDYRPTLTTCRNCVQSLARKLTTKNLLVIDPDEGDIDRFLSHIGIPNMDWVYCAEDIVDFIEFEDDVELALLLSAQAVYWALNNHEYGVAIACCKSAHDICVRLMQADNLKTIAPQLNGVYRNIYSVKHLLAWHVFGVKNGENDTELHKLLVQILNSACPLRMYEEKGVVVPGATWRLLAEVSWVGETTDEDERVYLGWCLHFEREALRYLNEEDNVVSARDCANCALILGRQVQPEVVLAGPNRVMALTLAKDPLAAIKYAKKALSIYQNNSTGADDSWSAKHIQGCSMLLAQIYLDMADCAEYRSMSIMYKLPSTAHPLALAADTDVSEVARRYVSLSYIAESSKYMDLAKRARARHGDTGGTQSQVFSMLENDLKNVIKNIWKANSDSQPDII